MTLVVVALVLIELCVLGLLVDPARRGTGSIGTALYLAYHRDELAPA